MEKVSPATAFTSWHSSCLPPPVVVKGKFPLYSLGRGGAASSAAAPVGNYHERRWGQPARHCDSGRLIHRLRASNRADAISSSGKQFTFCSSIDTDLPLYESPPWASFDDYLNDRLRVFEAMFPDKNRSQRLNDEEWRIQMLPLEFFFLSVRPVVDMRLRCLSQAKDYPPGISPTVTKVLCLQATRWELRGLDNVVKPTDFALGVQGAVYSEKQAIRSRLKGQLKMSITCILPPTLALIPEDILQGVSDSVLKRLLEKMKQKVNESLVSDFTKFRRDRLRMASTSQQPSLPPNPATN